jgi:hypothetical protein
MLARLPEGYGTLPIVATNNGGVCESSIRNTSIIDVLHKVCLLSGISRQSAKDGAPTLLMILKLEA